MPTIKVAISVKIQRWTRPRKDNIDLIFYHNSWDVVIFYYVKVGDIVAVKGQRTGYFVKCDNCGKEVYQTKTQYNRGKHHYCSNKCQKEFQHKECFEDRACIICGKIFHVSKKSTQRLCSQDCQKIWQTQQTGEKNSRYRRVEIQCEQCGKPYSVKAYKTTNGQHNFCSTECRRKWYAETFSQQEEWKEESKRRAVNILASGKIPFTNSSPQIIVNNLLDDMNVVYQNEYPCTYYSIDNYLIEENLMIEVMGDFWHCNPIKFETIHHDIQLKRIPKDKAKHSYIKNKYDIEILYLWESDINENPELCKELIKKYIVSNGNLENYHSFNYSLDSNRELVLNNTIIVPYQSMESSEVKTHIKIA